MKTGTWLLGLLLASAAHAATPVEQELLAVETAWAQALVKADVAALEKLYADEYIFTDPTGVTFSKADDIANARAGDFKLTTFAFSDLKVHVYGNVATVTGQNRMTGTWKGADASGTYRFTDVFVKRDGRWQVVASQGTRAAR